jgi:hypothetical protein
VGDSHSRTEKSILDPRLLANFFRLLLAVSASIACPRGDRESSTISSLPWPEVTHLMTNSSSLTTTSCSAATPSPLAPKVLVRRRPAAPPPRPAPTGRRATSADGRARLSPGRLARVARIRVTNPEGIRGLLDLGVLALSVFENETGKVRGRHGLERVK